MYKKIDIYVNTGKEFEYVCSTNRFKTCKDAKLDYCNRNRLSLTEVKTNFSKGVNMKQWKCQSEDNAKHLGHIEFQDNKEENHVFEIMQTDDNILFGSFTNIGFLQSGYMEISDCLSIDENLQAMIEDLETYYNDGKQFCKVIICNGRM